MIIITGAPAAGKTTISKKISEKFNLPIINKDEFKELLFDCLGIKDTEWAMKLGVASFELTYLSAEKLLQSGNSFIVEGNFDNKYSTKTFIDMKLRFKYKVLQIFCYAEDRILYERYVNRDTSGNRHPGHIRPISDFEDYKKTMNNKSFRLDIDGGIIRDVDTTNFESVNLQDIYDLVERSM